MKIKFYNNDYARFDRHIYMNLKSINKYEWILKRKSF